MIKASPLQVPHAQPNACITNVEAQVAKHGGKTITGWEVEKQRCYYQHRHHVIWQDKEGKHWEITPRAIGRIEDTVVSELAEIDFLPDEKAHFGDKSLPCHYVPVADNPNLAKGCECLARSDGKHLEGDLEGAKYWTRRALTYFRKAPQGKQLKDISLGGCSPDALGQFVGDEEGKG